MAYGVTTCAERVATCLPATLASLRAGGFGQPRLYADGVPNATAAELQLATGLDVTPRYPRVRTFGNFVLALWDLLLHDHRASHYALFQDDVACSKNLRGYLERVPMPSQGYLNLCTYPANQDLAPAGKTGWFRSNQLGKGAQGLVLPRQAAVALLGSPLVASRPTTAGPWWQNLDGCVVTALRAAGWSEYCHSPSLVIHTGDVSTLGHPPQPRAPSFRGEGFDLLALLQ